MERFKRIWAALDHLSLVHWLWTLGSSTVGSALIAGLVSVITEWPWWIYVALFAGLMLLLSAFVVDRIAPRTSDGDDVMAVGEQKGPHKEILPASSSTVEPKRPPVLNRQPTKIHEPRGEQSSATQSSASTSSVRTGQPLQFRQSLQEELRHGVMLRQRANGSSFEALASGVSPVTEDEVEQWEARVIDLLEDENRPLLVALFMADPPKKLGGMAAAAYWNPLGDRLGHRLQSLDSIIRSV